MRCLRTKTQIRPTIQAPTRPAKAQVNPQIKARLQTTARLQAKDQLKLQACTRTRFNRNRGKPSVLWPVNCRGLSMRPNRRCLILICQYFCALARLMYPVTETLPASDGRTTTSVKLAEVPADLMLDWLARAATFIRFDGRRKGWVKVDPRRQIAATLLVRQDRWRFPRVAGVIANPVLRPNGSLLTQPGYDPATQLYLALDPSLDLPPIPGQPSRAEAQAALKLLSDLLSGFVFASPTDRAVALSLILTTVARSALPVAPLHLIRAHTAGTGKSFLVDIAAAVATGRHCPVITAGQTAEEAEKRLGALLREGVPIVSLDNCSRDLDGDFLCQIAERPLVRTRILGLSEVPEFECRATIVATGNNVGSKGDMVRRTVTCNLVANVERPELRQFEFDPIAVVLRRNRDHFGSGDHHHPSLLHRRVP